MFKLQPASAHWEEILPGVEIQFAPITRAAVKVARAAAAKVADVDEEPEAYGEAFFESLIRQGVTDWRGIGDAKGASLKFSAPALELLIADARTYEACRRAYVHPYMQVDAEKNASSGSPSGTSADRTPAKPTARTAAVAKSARSKSTARTAPKARRPGT